jgi:cytochrome c-type biogenesis protein CcmF
LLASPDIKRFAAHDIYSHVSAVAPMKEKEWSELKEYKLSVGDTIFLNDYFAVFRAIEPAQQTAGLGLGKDDLAIQADMVVYGEKQRQYHAHPVFIVRNRLIGRVPDEIEDLGLRLSLNEVDPTAGKFTLGVSTTQKDYIILKAIEKPFINLLWSGTLLMAAGFSLALRKKKTKRAPAEVPAPQPAARATKKSRPAQRVA